MGNLSLFGFDTGISSQGMSDFGKLTGGLGQLGGAYASYKIGKDQNKLISQQNDLARENYAYNKSLNDREIAKENMAQDSLTNSVNSIWGNSDKKKKLGDYTSMYNFEG